MTDQERAQFFKDAEAYRKKITSSPEAAKQFLVRVGICTPKGNLRKPYKHLFHILARHKDLA
jgi:hypothetical protein